MKQKYTALLIIIILASILALYYSSSIVNDKLVEVGRIDTRIRRQQEILNSAKVLNQQLHEVSKVIFNTMTTDHFFTSEEVNSLVNRLADLADKYDIPIHSIVPRLIDSAGRHIIEQQYTIELEGTYIQLGQLLSDIEAHEHILKIRTLEVRPAYADRVPEDKEEMQYKITLQLSAFKIVKET